MASNCRQTTTPFKKGAISAWKSAEANWKIHNFSKVAQEAQQFVEFILKVRIMELHGTESRTHDLKYLARKASGGNMMHPIYLAAAEMEKRGTRGQTLSVSTRYPMFLQERGRDGHFDEETIPAAVYKEAEARFLLEKSLEIYRHLNPSNAHPNANPHLLLANLT